jgi:hypothetical protein
MAFSKHAFDCHHCPSKGGENGCPAWWETIWEKADGETQLVRGCGWEQLPHYITELIKASNRPAAAVESTRNEIAHGFARIAASMHQLPNSEVKRLPS